MGPLISLLLYDRKALIGAELGPPISLILKGRNSLIGAVYLLCRFRSLGIKESERGSGGRAPCLTGQFFNVPTHAAAVR